MKEHQFLASKVAAVFVDHCLAFQIIMLINFSIFNSFDADNLIRRSSVECSCNDLVFVTAGRQIELIKSAYNQ
jgi:hypothetical protein